MSHLDPVPLLLYRYYGVVFVFPLCTFHTNRLLVARAELGQRLPVFSAEVSGDESGRIHQLVLLQRRIPLVWREVKFAIRQQAGWTRLDRWGLVSAANVTGNLVSLAKRVQGIFPASWRRRKVRTFLLSPFGLNKILLNINLVVIFVVRLWVALKPREEVINNKPFVNLNDFSKSTVDLQ